MIKIAVVGVGGMGKNHARICSTLNNMELVALCDTDKERVIKQAKKYKTKSYTDYKELLKKEKIDAVSICVPTSIHKQVAVEAVRARKHVLIEKPIASTVEDGEDIVNEANKNKVKLMVGHIERFNPAIIELKKRIDKGQLGRIFKIDVNRVGPFPTRIRDVGVVIDLAVHDLDIIRYLTNSEVTEVFAFTEKRINTQHEDLLSGLLRLENKIICNLNINWLTPTKIRKLYITGEKGMFVVDYLQQDLYYYENEEINNDISYVDIVRGVTEGKMIRYPVDRKEPLSIEIEHFIDCIINDKQPSVSGKDSIEALKLALRIIDTSKK